MVDPDDRRELEELRRERLSYGETVLSISPSLSGAMASLPTGDLAGHWRK